MDKPLKAQIDRCMYAAVTQEVNDDSHQNRQSLCLTASAKSGLSGT
jgi:hypothetical protein